MCIAGHHNHWLSDRIVFYQEDAWEEKDECGCCTVPGGLQRSVNGLLRNRLFSMLWLGDPEISWNKLLSYSNVLDKIKWHYMWGKFRANLFPFSDRSWHHKCLGSQRSTCVPSPWQLGSRPLGDETHTWSGLAQLGLHLHTRLKKRKLTLRPNKSHNVESGVRAPYEM